MRFVFFAILITLACMSTVPAEGTDAGSNEQCILSDALKKVLDSFFNAKGEFWTKSHSINNQMWTVIQLSIKLFLFFFY